MKADVLPLVICNKDGKALDAALMNEKGFSKSIENKVLWVVHPETERLLPYKKEVPFDKLKKFGSYYKAVFKTDSSFDALDDEQTKDTEVTGAAEVSASAKSGVVYELAKIIKTRHQEMPEGSYTTHLFNKGIDKIRKKTGEEAVELILARDKGEIVYEAADLIYHMLVLLEASDISIDEIFTELEGRK